MTTTLWQDDHIYAAPDCPAIDADFQRAAEGLTEIANLLASLPETRTSMPCAICLGPSAARPTP